jgi:arylsulfatase A-like enzyme
MRRLLTSASLALVALAVLACGPSPGPVDLLGGGETLVEARAAGQGREAILEAGAQGLLISDVRYRGYPAGPPSRLVFDVDIPEGARLSFVCAIDPRFHDSPAVEFFVKVGPEDDERLVWSRLLDPISRPEDRHFVPFSVDLSKHAGRGRRLVLETRGYEEEGDPGRAFWGVPALTVPGARAPLAIIYLVDTLRADHTGIYAYDRPTTPALDAFAADGVVFDQAIAHSSWTKPSVASILTSLLPGQHRAVQLRDALDEANVTLAQRLDEHGFATGAAIANSVIYGAESAFDRGFDAFVGLHTDDDRRSKLVDADVVVDTALAWRRLRQGLPTFIYAHTMDPHVPYTPPPPFDRMFEPHPTEDHPGRDPRTDYKEPLDRERMVAQYDGEIAYGDREFGRFVTALKDAGVYEDALIVFIADHGEEFLDHGRWLHGRSVFDELVRVPLVVKFPGNRHAGRRVSAQVQGVDVVPTILEALGLPLPDDLEGQPLQRSLGRETSDRTALSEISHRGFVAFGVRTERDKFVRRFSPDDDSLYFDLVRDPTEQTSVLDDHRDRARLLEARGEQAMSPNPYRYVVQVSGDARYALRLETGGWIENVEASGFGTDEPWSVKANGRRLQLEARPKPGSPRQVAFTVRPVGVRVVLSATREGQPLGPGLVTVAGSSWHPPSLPWRLPDVESEAEREGGLDLFTPPVDQARGVQVWLTLPEGETLMELDDADRERLRALGYLGDEEPGAP